MGEERYTVSQAAELAGVKPYVLRYWEEELNLRIARNEMGHRYYTRYDIQLFLNIKELKKRGLQLRAIREVIPRIYHQAPGSPYSRIQLLTTAKKEVKEEEKVPEKMEPKDRMQEFQMILDKLITLGLQQKSQEEQRCRRLDESIRCHQRARREAAAAEEKKSRKKIQKKEKVS
ncbi:MAG TPA: helix-turn-helix domain-containing protein [Candidatus Blautia intestinigallinarum]|nr:MerR family transcriptional regulator [Candidatus Cottocaccamicrobium excrementipullorum]HIV35135.1 helix-turn-helix domain-containing protein [Candidatus Blautia intestinigallinarum]